IREETTRGTECTCASCAFCGFFLLLQDRRGAVDLSRDPIDRGSDDADLLGSFLPMMLLDCLAHPGQRLGAISRIKSRSVDFMPVPWPARQAAFVDHRQLDFPELIIQRLLNVAGCQTSGNR